MCKHALTGFVAVGGVRSRAVEQHTAKVLPSMEEDDRLLPILQNMSQINVGADYKARVTDGITADAVDSVCAVVGTRTCPPRP